MSRKRREGEAGEDGLSASVSTNKAGGRDETGKWLPGVSGNPRGRPSKAEELAILDSIRTSFPPEVIQAKLQKAMQLAEENNSSRGMVAVLEFAANYTLGKPVQRIIQETAGIGDIADELGVDLDE